MIDFDHDLEKLKQKLPEIYKFKGKLNEKDNFLKYLDLENEADKIIDKLYLYISSLLDQNQANPKGQIKFQKLSNTVMEFITNTSSFQPEIMKIGYQKIKTFLSSDHKYHKYLYPYQKLFRDKKTYSISERRKTFFPLKTYFKSF